MGDSRQKGSAIWRNVAIAGLLSSLVPPLVCRLFYMEFLMSPVTVFIAYLGGLLACIPWAKKMLPKCSGSVRDAIAYSVPFLFVIHFLITVGTAFSLYRVFGFGDPFD